MTAVVEREDAAGDGREPAATASPRSGFRRGWMVLGVLAAWTVCAIAFQGKATPGHRGRRPGRRPELARRPRERRRARRRGNVVVSFTHWIADVLGAIIEWLQFMISTPAFPSPYPHIGFLGVLAIAWYVTAVVAGWRMSILTGVCFALFSLLGFYRDSMDLLIVTLLAVVLLRRDRAAARRSGWPTAAAPGRSSRRSST